MKPGYLNLPSLDVNLLVEWTFCNPTIGPTFSFFYFSFFNLFPEDSTLKAGAEVRPAQLCLNAGLSM
jgi:hypothetical protein